jgi:hypothetical protein
MKRIPFSFQLRANKKGQGFGTTCHSLLQKFAPSRAHYSQRILSLYREFNKTRLICGSLRKSRQSEFGKEFEDFDKEIVENLKAINVRIKVIRTFINFWILEK